MTPRGRTNQLIYQAELLLDSPPGNDEHAMARRMALEEGALALLELALNTALRELTEHAQLPRHDWRELLSVAETEHQQIAELARLREMARDPQSWLAVLIAHIDALQDTGGVARREAAESLIVAADRVALASELRWCMNEFKTSLSGLRETSIEW